MYIKYIEKFLFFYIKELGVESAQPRSSRHKSSRL